MVKPLPQTAIPSETKQKVGDRRLPATRRVQTFILQEIDAGRLKPGMRVNAAKIATALQLSAAPVREALAVLAGKGILDLLPERGAIIRQVTAAEIKHLWHVIAALGSTGLELAADNIARGADTKALQDAYDSIFADMTAVDSVAFFLRLNAYHNEVHILSGNPFIATALDRLGLDYWDRYLANYINVLDHIDGYRGNYQRMHDAVLAADGAAAGAVMQYHCRWSIALIDAAAS